MQHNHSHFCVLPRTLTEKQGGIQPVGFLWNRFKSTFRGLVCACWCVCMCVCNPYVEWEKQANTRHPVQPQKLSRAGFQHHGQVTFVTASSKAPLWFPELRNLTVFWERERVCVHVCEEAEEVNNGHKSISVFTPTGQVLNTVWIKCKVRMITHPWPTFLPWTPNPVGTGL